MLLAQGLVLKDELGHSVGEGFLLLLEVKSLNFIGVSKTREFLLMLSSKLDQFLFKLLDLTSYSLLRLSPFTLFLNHLLLEFISRFLLYLVSDSL